MLGKKVLDHSKFPLCSLLLLVFSIHASFSFLVLPAYIFMLLVSEIILSPAHLCLFLLPDYPPFVVSQLRN